MALRCIVNLFYNNASRYILENKSSWVINKISPCINSANKNIRQAVITIMLNYSVAICEKKETTETRI